MTDTEDARKYRAPALEKGLDVLELLAIERGGPMTLSQISVALERSVSELFRMVQVLEFRGYVAAVRDGFVLTDRLFALGMTRAPTRNLLETALPIMRQFAEGTGQSCHLALASHEQMVVVARVEAPGDQGYSVRVGYRRNIVLATSGLVLFAFQPSRVRAAWKADLLATTDEAQFKAFEMRAERARHQGYVRADSAVTPLVVDLSAPIMGGEGVAAALTTPYVNYVTALGEEATIAQLRSAASQISAELDVG